MPRPSIVLCLLAALVVGGCSNEPTPAGDRGRSPAANEDDAMPSESPVGEGVEVPTSTACVNGWVVPDDPEQRELPFHVIRRTQRVDGEFDVVEMRYFEGPESPPSTKGYLQVVDRWYVKARLQGDPSFRGRWLIEERSFGSGVVAVAPFGSEGFSSPDWVGFQYETSDPSLQRHPGLPGRWAGRPYDFVAGTDMETGEPVFRFAGLPPEVAGCLEGT
ncbi:MAG: hypothetical protein ACRDJP_16575 [Actinomycetota bacterium]